MSRKFVVTIVLILFLLPFVSWYYLQSGLNWRKKAQEVMNGNELFPQIAITLTDGRPYPTDSLQDKVTLVCFRPCEPFDEQAQVLEQLYNQFKDTGKAKFLLMDSCIVESGAGVDSHRKGIVPASCSANHEVCESLKNSWPSDKPFALVDRKGVIRSYYGIGSNEEKRILVEHMSLLLPRDRQEKVELKRGEQQ